MKFILISFSTKKISILNIKFRHSIPPILQRKSTSKFSIANGLYNESKDCKRNMALTIKTPGNHINELVINHLSLLLFADEVRD